MSIARKTQLIVAVPLLFELVFLILFLGAERRAEQYREWQARSTETALLAERLLVAASDAHSARRSFATTKDPALLERYGRAKDTLAEEVRQLEMISRIETEEQLRSHVPDRYTVDTVKHAMATVVRHLEDPAIGEDVRTSVLEDFRSDIRGFQHEELERQREERTELEHYARIRRYQAFAFIVTNILLTIAMLVFLLRRTRRRLQYVIDNMNRLAAGEPLHPPTAGSDEIDKLDDGFHEMAERLELARRDLSTKNEELARLNAEKSRFLGMAAHDLRTPLFGTLTSAELLMRRKTLSDADRQLVDRIRAAVGMMSNLVTDFLDVSMIEAGELRLRRSETDLASVVRECVAMHEPLAAQKQIAIDLEANGAAPAFIDREKIAQVLTNLLTNAIKFSPQGSCVTVRVGCESDGDARVDVIDEGQGIAPEEMERLFQPFSRTSARSTAGESSTGLGLLICKKIVEGHGGRIWAEGEDGKGASFSFVLPSAS
ncbi:MAG: hypothetical protein JOZ54_09945 [Acidobacteria bacterium]|nr:hypothetical protein [Acidobacteriota bacterium]